MSGKEKTPASNAVEAVLILGGVLGSCYIGIEFLKHIIMNLQVMHVLNIQGAPEIASEVALGVIPEAFGVDSGITVDSK